MRLVKINDIILNMDRIAVIKGKARSEDYGGGVSVYAYLDSSNYVELGVCETQEYYEKFMSSLYKDFSEQFIGEVIIEDDEDKELWE